MKNIVQTTIVMFLYIFLLTGFYENFIAPPSGTALKITGVVIVVILTIFLIRYIVASVKNK